MTKKYKKVLILMPPVKQCFSIIVALIFDVRFLWYNQETVVYVHLS